MAIIAIKHVFTSLSTRIEVTTRYRYPPRPSHGIGCAHPTFRKIVGGPPCRRCSPSNPTQRVPGMKEASLGFRTK